MLKVSALNDTMQGGFLKLFEDYYKELGCDDDCAHLVDEYIIPDLLAGLLHVDMLQENETLCGFVIYQKDDIDNEWNFLEGWGDIREIYILPSYRRKGYGKFLLYTAEMKLKEGGIDRAYALPGLGAEDFFKACGYAPSDDYCPELDCLAFKKTNLNNCECGGKR